MQKVSSLKCTNYCQTLGLVVFAQQMLRTDFGTELNLLVYSLLDKESWSTIYSLFGF